MTDDVSPAQDSDALVLGERSELAEAFMRLRAAANPHKRGRQFEVLLERAFQLAHFQVHFNPGMARPRQTDLSARYGDRRYLVEAKWQGEKTDVDVLGGMRDRLRRTDSSVVGVIVSIAGFTGTVIDEIGRERNMPILLVDGADLLGVLRDPVTLPGLFQAKLEELITHGRVHLGSGMSQRAAASRPDRTLPSSELAVWDLQGQRHPYLAVPGGFAPVVFATEVTDVDWAFGRGRGVCLDMPVAARDQEDVIRLLHGLDELGLASAQPTWALQQKDVSWFGIGAGELVQALDDAQARTASLDAPHHSEQLVYSDTCLGGLYTLTADINLGDGAYSVPRRQIMRCQISFQLPGTPLDSAPLQHLFDRFAATRDGHFRHLDGAATQTSWQDRRPVEPLARIVQHDPVTKDAWVVGLVIRDHYSAEGRHAVLEGWPLELQHTGFLACALAHHHPVDQSPESYWIERVSTAWTSDLAVTTVRANW
ncbi:restriction endonuclease [Peterkaempfera bronchialis]|uniref:restriction endonuclease n=1 Tax=Peterkaempfera bronchialis TaxID=2126346 RepID=UPI003C2E5905